MDKLPIQNVRTNFCGDLRQCCQQFRPAADVRCASRLRICHVMRDFNIVQKRKTIRAVQVILMGTQYELAPENRRCSVRIGQMMATYELMRVYSIANLCSETASIDLHIPSDQ